MTEITAAWGRGSPTVRIRGLVATASGQARSPARRVGTIAIFSMRDEYGWKRGTERRNDRMVGLAAREDRDITECAQRERREHGHREKGVWRHGRSG